MTKLLSEMTNEELWQLFPIVLTGHRDEWLQWYEEERDNIIRLIGDENVIRISHIGSTAVPGLIAKPTIDILLEITDECSVQKLKETFEQNGYIFSSQPDNPPPHMTFLMGYTLQGFAERVFHIHVRFRGDWDELIFCDYLKKQPDIAAQYGELKLQLKQRYEHDRDAYTDAKTEFVKCVTSLARKEESQSQHGAHCACSVGIIGGANGPTAVFVSEGRHDEKNEIRETAWLNACKEAAMPEPRLKTGNELKAYLIEAFGAITYEPMPYTMETLKLGALINHHRDVLFSPQMPDESAPKEEWLEWANKTHTDFREASKRLPDDVFGFRYAFLSLPRNRATAKYYRFRNKENRKTLLNRIKSLFNRQEEDELIVLDIELTTCHMQMRNGCSLLISDLVLWRGITQSDIDGQTPEFMAYASAMKDTGQLKL